MNGGTIPNSGHTPSNSSANDSTPNYINVAELNREIKSIRSSRDETGCSCKHVKIDKLSVVKLKSELRQCLHVMSSEELSTLDFRIEDVESMSKSEMMIKLKHVIRHCPMCTTNSCECVALGVPCDAEVCSCLRSGYRPDQQQSCENVFGRRLFDKEAVDEYRSRILETFRACSPESSGTNSIGAGNNNLKDRCSDNASAQVSGMSVSPEGGRVILATLAKDEKRPKKSKGTSDASYE